MKKDLKFILRNEAIVPRDAAMTHIDDRGYQFGDGIYEVIRLYRGKPFLMREHLARLRASAEKLNMEIGFSGEDLSARLIGLMEKEPVETGTVYIQVTRGIHPRVQELPPRDLPVELTAYIRPLDRPRAKLEAGVSTILIHDIRWLRCDIKSLNLIPNILARQNAADEGAFEALQHRDGVITEGAFSNIFRVSDGTIFTHPEGNLVLSGITRAHVFALCSDAGYTVREERFAIGDLLASDEVFITSTTNEVMPVIQIGGQGIGDGKPGKLTRRLQALYEASFQQAVRNPEIKTRNSDLKQCNS